MTERLSEFEKMRTEEFYDFSSEECLSKMKDIIAFIDYVRVI